MNLISKFFIVIHTLIVFSIISAKADPTKKAPVIPTFSDSTIAFSKVREGSFQKIGVYSPQISASAYDVRKRDLFNSHIEQIEEIVKSYGCILDIFGQMPLEPQLTKAEVKKIATTLGKHIKNVVDRSRRQPNEIRIELRYTNGLTRTTNTKRLAQEVVEMLQLLKTRTRVCQNFLHETSFHAKLHSFELDTLVDERK
ncbi:MAG: hypothetical protein AB7F43_13055 [Bacteriovoracia bacterium]